MFGRSSTLGVQSAPLNWYAIPPFLAGTLNVALILWVATRAAPGPLRQTFLLWTASHALWNFSIGVGYSLDDVALISLWYKATIPLAISWLAPLFLHFV